MGMFDSLLIPCLFCKEEIEEQTKSGPCALQCYKWDDPDLPVWMMDEFNGIEIECYHCNRTFRLVFDFEVIVRERRLETVDNLSMLELEQIRKEEKEGG